MRRAAAASFICAAAVAFMCATTVNAAVSTSGAVARAATSSRPLPASVHFSGAGHGIPHGFFGLSIEYNELPLYELSGPLFDRVISLIRPRDGGPMTLRVGGKSADHTLWEPTAPAVPGSEPKPLKLPPRTFKIDQGWLTNLSQLVHREDLRVILDLNLAVHSTTMETSFASAARNALHGRLTGLEIGNEPDEYHHQPPLSLERVPSTSVRTPVRWWNNYSAADYRRDYTTYARALKASVPGVTLGAPDIVSAQPTWLAAVTGLGRLDPGFLAIHRYASSTCWPVNSPEYPTVRRLLSEAQSAGLANSVTSAVGFAHSHHMQLRITEINSVSCDGNPGVANSFATALWAPDALFGMIKAGVEGVSWHIRPKTVNAPFQFIPGGIVPLPELYGLAMFAQMTSGGARVLGSTVTASPALHLKAWGVRAGNTVRVLLINKGSRPANVTLPAGAAHGPAVVRRLLAPRIGFTTRVRFAGMWIGSDGRWHGHRVESRISAVGGSYHVFVPRYSAALVTL